MALLKQRELYDLVCHLREELELLRYSFRRPPEEITNPAEKLRSDKFDKLAGLHDAVDRQLGTKHHRLYKAFLLKRGF
jgi:hypothetical protein